MIQRGFPPTRTNWSAGRSATSKKNHGVPTPTRHGAPNRRQSRSSGQQCRDHFAIKFRFPPQLGLNTEMARARRSLRYGSRSAGSPVHQYRPSEALV